MLRGVVFLLVFLGSLPILNSFHWSDEYRFAAWLRAGESIADSHHLLSALSGYLVWWFTSLFGIEISAYQALRGFNELMLAIGVVALVDLGVFLGVRPWKGLLLCLPLLFSNGIIRYATSAYPAVGAIGWGLLAMNFLVRSF